MSIVSQEYQSPINLTATDYTYTAWYPDVFTGVANNSNFSLNLWLIRHDNKDATTYLPVIVAQNYNVYNAGAYWTPTYDDIDVGVPTPGTHQYSWELNDDNPDAEPDNTNLRDFSPGFNILGPSGWSYTSQTSSVSSTATVSSGTTTAGAAVTSAQSSTSSTSTSLNGVPTTSSSSGNNSLAIGLGVGLGLAATLSAIVIAILMRRKKKRQQNVGAVTDLSYAPEGGLDSGTAHGWDTEAKPSVLNEPPAESRSELPSDQYKRHELPSDTYQKIPNTDDPRYELD